MSTLLKNVNIVSSKGVLENKDVLIVGCFISEIADNIKADVDSEYDLTGKYLMPGVIDTHVHLRSPGFEEKEDFRTGSMAALAGGVTTVFDMPNTNPPTTTLEGLKAKRKLAQENSLVNFGLFFGANSDNLEDLKKAPGIVGVKVYMGNTTASGDVDDNGLDNLFERLFTEFEYTIAVHAENEGMIKEREAKYKDQNDPAIHSLIRNDLCSLSATKRAVHLAKKFNGRLHVCHLSTKKEVELLMKYPEENITCEVTPHHLFLNVEDYAKQGNFVKVNPPLRSGHDQEGLMEALSKGIIESVATDHAPHLAKEKEQDYWDAPSGVPGLETSLPLMLNAVNQGQLTLQQVVGVMCENPTKIYGIKNKGEIKLGYEADLVVVDMDMEKEVRNDKLYTKCGWSPFNGRKLKGWPVMTFVRGHVGMKDGKIVEGTKPREVELE